MVGPQTSDSAASWPKTVQCKGLTIQIYYHGIPSQHGDVSCWTYISSGLCDYEQPELVITLRRRDSESPEAYSVEPLEWFKIVQSWGKNRRLIDAFNTHELHSQHWLGSKNLATVTHGMPICLPGIPLEALPKKRLHGIAITSYEAMVAKKYGFTRLLGRYGWSERWFPYVPWIDRDRDDCIRDEQLRDSLRPHIDMKRVRGLTVRWQGNYIIMEIPAGREADVEALVRQLKPNVPWGFESFMHADADCGFIWEYGQKDLMAYSAG